MRRLSADISDQTCKTAAQSRTRFVGHRQLPWIQLEHSCQTSFPSFRGASHDANPESRCWTHNDFGIPDQSGARIVRNDARLMRAQLALALDHFGRKLEIGF